MQNNALWDQFEELSPTAQRQVADFIAELSARGKQENAVGNARRSPIGEESFVGMWRDRDDLADSSCWVRRMRAEEWGQ
jgi:hypothetical protein